MSRVSGHVNYRATRDALAIQVTTSNSRVTIITNTGVTRKRTMSAAARASISKATKARWAKFRAEKAKKAK